MDAEDDKAIEAAIQFRFTEVSAQGDQAVIIRFCRILRVDW